MGDIPYMTDVSNWQRYSARPVAAVWKLTVAALAVTGFFWLAGGPLFRTLIHPLLFVTEVVRREYSPDRAAVADVEVTRGGFGTVWTTRVYLGSPDRRQWIVYQTRDSDFIPPLHWLDRHTLRIGLPCGRFDHVSNPDDWESSEPRPNRLQVRVERPSNCPSG